MFAVHDVHLCYLIPIFVFGLVAVILILYEHKQHECVDTKNFLRQNIKMIPYNYYGKDSYIILFDIGQLPDQDISPYIK